MDKASTKRRWFHIARVFYFSLMWVPIHWKGWLLALALIATITGVVVLGAVFKLLPAHGEIIFLTIVLVVIGFQVLVFKHSK